MNSDDSDAHDAQGRGKRNLANTTKTAPVNQTTRLRLGHVEVTVDRDEITNWRPKQSTDVVGAENRRKVREIMEEIKTGKWGGPLAFVGQYGTAKTSCSRLVACCLCCPAFREACEPCGDCEACRSQSPAYSGNRHQYRHWELDCANVSLRRLVKFCSQIEGEEKAVVTFDEIPNLVHAAAQRSLLKFTEEFKGVLLFAITVDDDFEPLEKKIIPPLYDRLREKRLLQPPEKEMVEFFLNFTGERRIAADEAAVRLMVQAARKSFRKCLKVLACAKRKGGLTASLIGEALELPRWWQDDFEGSDERK